MYLDPIKFDNRSNLEPISEQPKKNLSPWLIAGVVILLIATIIMVVFYTLNKIKKTAENINSTGNLNLNLNIPVNQNNNTNANYNINANLKTPLNTLPENSGASAITTITLANNVSVTLPTIYSLYSGWQEKLNLTFTNNSTQSQTVDLKFKGLPFTYINNLTSDNGNYQYKIFDLATINLNPKEVKNQQLNLQTTKVWSHYLTLYLNETEQKINLEITIKDKTPLLGKDTAPCAYDLPYDQKFGPDCGEGLCDGLSNDKECVLAAKKADSKTCYPYQFTYNSELEKTTTKNCQTALQFNSQIIRNYAPISWGVNMINENTYFWEKSDWFIDVLSNKYKAEQAIPSGLMSGGSWTNTCTDCTNPDGSKGFYDLDNSYLVNKFKQYAFDVSARYKDRLNYYEMANEPAAEFYLCDCDLKNDSNFSYIPSNTPSCTATSGPNQPACNSYGSGHNYTQAFNNTYGEFLTGTVKIASEEIKKNNPRALVVTGAIDDQGTGLTPVTKDLIDQGILNNGNVAIGVHQYPHNGLSQLWSMTAVNCSYYQKPDNAFWLPEECEKAPPLANEITMAKGKTITASRAWGEMDKRYDASKLLKDAQTLGVLDKIYFFDSEMHAGFSNISPKYDLSEAIAGVRIGVMNAHQKFLGTVYVLFNTNNFNAPIFNQMTKFLTGVTPVYKWQSKLIDSDYNSVVYKLFTRGNEDILVFWSNNNQTKTVSLSANDNFNKLGGFEITDFDANRGSVDFMNISRPNVLDKTFNLKSVKEIKVISVLRPKDTQPLDWLDGINY